ncbi:uncharacterized protein LOC112089221 [Eutrema salsugineum]|uniref:uncharacterized protein LOC112089221 n=1 Tax=Eutrema salsugineum TaxID=72664 RepID=UPI000CED43DB|nr:uncharacterized protein LOC112089221 [Eutrema salsugineum]
MDGVLNQALQSMSLEEEEAIDIPDEEDYSAVQVNSRSLIGKLLNPECQNMARMLRIMPRIWKVYNRVRGIALSKESFQFIFERDTDIETVMKDGIWSFDDWSMVLDRWVENPPVNFLKTAPIWIRISKIPLYFCTLKTIDAIANKVGQVKEILFDPEKSRFQEFFRALVIVDLEQPLRDTRRQPKRNETGANHKPEAGSSSRSSGQAPRQHHTDLADKLMPLLAPSVPTGFTPLQTTVAPEVFEEMRLYMNCTDPTEKVIREHRMKKALDDLSKDPIAQRSILRLEPPPVISSVLDKRLGKVFDFRTVEMEHSASKGDQENLQAKSPSTSRAGQGTTGTTPDLNEHNDILQRCSNTLWNKNVNEVVSAGEIRVREVAKDTMEGSDNFIPPPTAAGFSMGIAVPCSSHLSANSRGSQKTSSSWLRRKRATSGVKITTQLVPERAIAEEMEQSSKRKAIESTRFLNKIKVRWFT